MSGFGARNIQMDRRGERVFEAIVESGSLVVRQFGGDRAGEVGAHRFFEAPDISFETIGDRFAARTRHAAQGRRIVVAQDTTEINFSGRDRGRKGLGPAGNGKALGFFIHPLIAVDIDTEALLGLCWSKIWTRSDTGLRHRRARDFADKESYRWLQATSAAGVLLDAAAAVVMVADREGDIYPHFARRPDNVDVIIRAAQDRNLAAGGHLFAALEALPALGGQRVDVGSRRIGRKGRTARVVLKAGQVRIRRPQHGCWRDDPDYLELNVVEAREIDAPEGAAPLLWRLVTTLPVTTLGRGLWWCVFTGCAGASRKSSQVLKSDGLKLEESQMASGEKLFKLAAMALGAAVRIIQLRDARDGSERPATDVIDAGQIEPAAMIGKTLEGRTQRQKNPHEKGSLAWLAWIVARLGGWNCYYKPPGPKTMARGWPQLTTMLKGVAIATKTQNV